MPEVGFKQKRLGEMLLDASIITQEQLNVALNKQLKNRKRLGKTLVSLGFTDEEVILTLLGKQLKAPYIKLPELGEIDRQILEMIPIEVAQKNSLLPLKISQDTLVVAMTDPANKFLKNVLSLLTGYKIQVHICNPKEINQAIEQYYKPMEELAPGVQLPEVGKYPLPLKQLGFSSFDLSIYTNSIDICRGWILIVGPKDSGKKTTLYSTLRNINFPDKDIISVEDKIDQKIEGVNQIEVMPKLGLNFSDVIEAALNSNPDVLAVSGAKDISDFRLLARAAEKGIFVISSVDTEQTNEEFLVDLAQKLGYYQVAENIELVVKQRLVRTICPYCKVNFKINKDALQKSGMSDWMDLGKEGVSLAWGKGCPKCNNSGYFGYTGCFEVVQVRDEVKDLILEKAAVNKIRKVRKKLKMADFKDNLKDKLLKQITTIEEVMRVQGMDINKPRYKNIYKILTKPETQTLDEDNIYWSLFEKTGSVNAYLMYDQMKKSKKKTTGKKLN